MGEKEIARNLDYITSNSIDPDPPFDTQALNTETPGSPDLTITTDLSDSYLSINNGVSKSLLEAQMDRPDSGIE